MTAKELRNVALLLLLGVTLGIVVLAGGCGFKHETPGNCMAFWPAKCDEGAK